MLLQTMFYRKKGKATRGWGEAQVIAITAIKPRHAGGGRIKSSGLIVIAAALTTN